MITGHLCGKFFFKDRVQDIKKEMIGKIIRCDLTEKITRKKQRQIKGVEEIFEEVITGKFYKLIPNHHLQRSDSTKQDKYQKVYT